jgi:acyl-CoA thioesterase FadM
MPVTHRPERDGTPVRARHVPYYLALEVAALAWAQLLDDLGDGALKARDVGVVRAEFDFRRELFVGELDVDVEVLRLGASSVSFGLELHQDGEHAATGTTVVARTDTSRLRSVPLSDQQRALLAPLLVGGGNAV